MFVCFPSFKPMRKLSSAMPKLFLSQSVYLVFSFSRVLYCVFYPNPCNNNRSFNPLTMAYPVACKHIHTYTALPFSCCPSLSFSVTHKFHSLPPPPNKSLPLPSLTPNHSLPLTLNDCEITKTLGKHQTQSPHHSRGGLKTAKIPTGRKL